MEPYPAPLEFGRRIGHRRERSYPTQSTKAAVSFFEDDDDKKNWLGHRKRRGSGSWLFAGKRKQALPPVPALPNTSIPRSLPNTPQMNHSIPRFSSDSSNSVGNSSQDSSLPTLSTTTSPSLTSSSPKPPSMPPKRPPRPEHGLFDNPEDLEFFTILPAPRPSQDSVKEDASTVDNTELNGGMSDNVEQLMLEVDQAFREVGVALNSAQLGRPSIGPAASPPASRSTSVRKRRSLVADSSQATQFTAPTRKTAVAKHRSHHPNSLMKSAARNAQEKRGRWTMTDSFADFVRKSRLRRVVVEEILSPRRIDEISHRASGDRIDIPIESDSAAVSIKSFNEPVDSRRSSVYSNNGAAVPHPVSPSCSREDLNDSKPDGIGSFSDRSTRQCTVVDFDENAVQPSKSPNTLAPPPKNPARFNRLAVDTMPTIVEGQKDLRPSTADGSNHHRRGKENGSRKSKKQVPDVNLTEFQSAIICGAGDLATGMAEDDELEMMDDMTDWFETFGFESHGQLIADGNRRRQHQRDTSRSIESVRSLDSTTSTISDDLDLPIPTSTLNPSETNLAQQASLHESDKIVICEEEEGQDNMPQSPESKVRVSCNFTDDLDSFLEWTPVMVDGSVEEE